LTNNLESFLTGENGCLNFKLGAQNPCMRGVAIPEGTFINAGETLSTVNAGQDPEKVEKMLEGRDPAHPINIAKMR
jgi:hypothetical protein